MPSREGFKIISDHFAPGQLAPVQVIVQTDDKDVQVKEALQALSFVSRVSEPQQGQNDQSLLSYQVELKENPYSNEPMDQIPTIKEAVQSSLKNSDIILDDKHVWISGQTAIQYDTRQTANKDAARVIPVIIAIIAILLLTYLRSLVAMVYLIATVLLSYFSALGLG